MVSRKLVTSVGFLEKNSNRCGEEGGVQWSGLQAFDDLLFLLRKFYSYGKVYGKHLRADLEGDLVAPLGQPARHGN